MPAALNDSDRQEFMESVPVTVPLDEIPSKFSHYLTSIDTQRLEKRGSLRRMQLADGLRMAVILWEGGCVREKPGLLGLLDCVGLVETRTNHQRWYKHYSMAMHG